MVKWKISKPAAQQERKIFGVSFAIFLLGMASLLTDASSDMITPLLPLFIVSVGGAAVAVGFIGGFADSVSSILKVFSGYLSDLTRRRKPIVISGYALSSLSKVFYAFSFSWPVVFLLRTLDRTGKGIRDAPRDAMIASYADAGCSLTAFFLALVGN